MWKSRASLAGLLLALIAPACTERPATDKTTGGPAAGAQPGAGAVNASGATAVAGALHFIENDAPQALAEAKRRGVPIFVEAWAPW